MGVDAEMFARVRGRENWLTDDQELPAAVELAQAIDHDAFFINLGDDVSGETHHALSIMRPISGAKDAEYNGLDESMIGKVVWMQDGDPIVAAQDEQFIKVHLWTRYYGEDYARGDWPRIRAVAEWLEFRFRGCEVWYGGDSSGICAEHLSTARRDQINGFYLESGRKSYTRYTGGFDMTMGIGGAKCPRCKIPMIPTGGGRDVAFLYCDGCGKKLKKHSTGHMEWLEKGRDFMEVAKQ